MAERTMTRLALVPGALLALTGCASPAPVRPAAAPAPAPAAAPLAAAPDTASALEAITGEAIRAHVRFLSSDLLEGRAPGTRGGQLAAEYIASEFERMGLQPVNGSYFQRVPILGVTARPAAVRVAFSGPRGRLAANYTEDVVAWTLTQKPVATASGPVVFVGYGINAPEYRWNDYEGVDAHGKIVMMLVNDPPATTQEPDLFGGRAMTYYGRWTYKLEEAERQGAAGVILVHTTESASYPWNVVTGSWTGEQYQLPLKPERVNPLAVGSWVTQDAARRLLALGGQNLDALTAAAQRRGFRAVATGVSASYRLENDIRRLETANVVGLRPGKSDEVVIFSAHYDHLGVGQAVNGDSIYNGALDNASGVAVILAAANGFASLDVPPARGILFMAVAAEESGLLGAQFYAENPLFPPAKTAADLNIDMTHFLGPTTDIEQLGGDRSTLGAELDAVLAPLGMHATGDPRPEAGSFFRSDHFPFAKAGIPALYFKSGEIIAGKPAGWGAQQLTTFNDKNYHQPSDEFSDAFNWSTGEQLARIAFRLGYRIANDPKLPNWLPSSEFQRKP
jgi:Zn-dependent M28 family amino/carboxypeptidase